MKKALVFLLLVAAFTGLGIGAVVVGRYGGAELVRRLLLDEPVHLMPHWGPLR